MSTALLFWVIYLVGFLFLGYYHRNTIWDYLPGSLIWWILIGLLGYQVFGSLWK